MTKRQRVNPLQWLEGLKKQKKDEQVRVEQKYTFIKQSEKPIDDDVLKEEETNVEEKTNTSVKEPVKFEDKKFSEVTIEQLEVIPSTEWHLYKYHRADFTKPVYLLRLKQKRYFCYRPKGEDLYKTGRLCVSCTKQVNGVICRGCSEERKKKQ